MNEKDVITLMASTIESTTDGNASINKETPDAMIIAINDKLYNLDKRVYNLEYAGHCDKSTSVVDMMELRKELNSLKCKVDQIEAALNMSKKYRKRHDKVSTKD